jgi:hypothetical protein
MPEVLSQLPQAIATLCELTGATEFHFAHIYQGKREFKGVDLSVRLALFGFMSRIFQMYQFPVFVQTFDPISLDAIKVSGGFPDRCGPFDLSSPAETALLFLLLRVKWFLEEKAETARVFVDEGYKKDGTALLIPTFASVFADGLVCFARSNSVLPIQMADFAGFALNREQLLVGKNPLNALDVGLLEILAPVVQNFWNILIKTERFQHVGEDWCRIP